MSPVNFESSPALLTPRGPNPATKTVGDFNDTQVAWIKRHAPIAPYLAMVARAAANAGIDPAFQAAVLAQENGGFDKWSTNARSSANAQGIAQFIPSTWAGSWNPYRNKSPNDVKYAIPAQSLFLRRLLRDHGGDMSRAAAAYYGTDSFTPTYVAGVRRYYSELKSNNVFAGKGGGSNVFGSVAHAAGDVAGGIADAAGAVAGGVGDIIGIAGDTASALPKLVDTLLHPEKLGELVADAFSIFFRFVFKAFWKWVIAPPFHWCQRATIYYFDNIMGSADGENKGYYYDYAGIATIAFWSVGYAILWRDADSPTQRATDPANTALGKATNGIGSLIGRRKVTAPNKVKERTPEKPTPKKSTAKVTMTRSLSATRRRQVTIGNGKGTENGTRETADLSPEANATDTAPAAN